MMYIETSQTEIVKFSLQKFSFVSFYWNHYKKLFFSRKQNFRQLIRKLCTGKKMSQVTSAVNRAFKKFLTPITRNYNNFVLIALLNVYFLVFIPLPETWGLSCGVVRVWTLFIWKTWYGIIYKGYNFFVGKEKKEEKKNYIGTKCVVLISNRI